MTVNTLYFWEQPVDLLKELSRVLKPKGKLIITFTKKETMETLPFVQNRFTMYSQDEFNALVDNTNLKIDVMNEHKDEVESKSGESIHRKFWITVLTHKS